jgi:hypothetical protein
MLLVDLPDRLFDPIIEFYQPRVLWVRRFIDRVVACHPRVVLVVLHHPEIKVG